MKHKMLAILLALTVASWAQTSTPTAPSTPQQSTAPAEKAKCACCDKMTGGDMKDMHASCCAHHDMGKDKDMQSKDSKEMASCCAGKEGMSGKDAKACMRDGQDKQAASCCKGSDKNSCGKDKTASACCGSKCEKDGKGCCSGSKDKTAKNCCAKELQS
jgi:hypothetical protein